MKKLKIGILGCGNISDWYLDGIMNVFGNSLELVAVSDLVTARANEKAEKYGIKKAYSPDSLFADKEVELIVNLTIPAVHEETTLRALKSGKHVYTKKPLALTREGAARIAAAAKEKNLLVGVATDTFMSAPVQTVKKMLEDNVIGDIVGVNTICPLRGNESWRPDSDFFYKKGAGPIFDMSPYYFNILIDLLGSFKSVTACGRTTWKQRTYTCKERFGDKINVEVPTHVVGLFEMANGVLVNFTNSFDIHRTAAPYVEIFGETGTITMPFPNFYKGDVMLSRNGGEWEKVEQLDGYDNFMRGAAIADMAKCLHNGKKHLASVEMGCHVVDVMNCFEEAITSGQKIEIKSDCPSMEGMWNREALK